MFLPWQLLWRCVSREEVYIAPASHARPADSECDAPAGREARNALVLSCAGTFVSSLWGRGR